MSCEIHIRRQGPSNETLLEHAKLVREDTSSLLQVASVQVDVGGEHLRVRISEVNQLVVDESLFLFLGTQMSLFFSKLINSSVSLVVLDGSFSKSDEFLADLSRSFDLLEREFISMKLASN
jgi:hypothetical protein